MLSRRAALGLAGLVPVAACSASGPGAPAPPPVTAGSGVSDAAQALAQSLARGDRAAFVAGFAARLRTQAAIVFDNAARLGSFALDADAGQRALRVRWRVGAERDASTALAGVDVSADGLVVALDEPVGGAPCWWRHRVVVLGEGPAWLVAPQGRVEASRPWLDAGAAALEHVRAARLEPWAAAWDSSLVMEVPFDLLGFAGRPGSAAYTAFPAATDGGRVVLNPTLMDQVDENGRIGILVHESVHVVTRAAFMEAPLWVAEGLAEHAATQVWAEAAADNARRVREVVDASPPAELPSPAQLRGSEALTAYALAAVAVEACFQGWGRAESLAWMAAWSSEDRPPEADLTAAYLARLRGR